MHMSFKGKAEKTRLALPRTRNVKSKTDKFQNSRAGSISSLMSDEESPRREVYWEGEDLMESKESVSQLLKEVEDSD